MHVSVGVSTASCPRAANDCACVLPRLHMDGTECMVTLKARRNAAPLTCRRAVRFPLPGAEEHLQMCPSQLRPTLVPSFNISDMLELMLELRSAVNEIVQPSNI